MLSTALRCPCPARPSPSCPAPSAASASQSGRDGASSIPASRLFWSWPTCAKARRSPTWRPGRGRHDHCLEIGQMRRWNCSRPGHRSSAWRSGPRRKQNGPTWSWTGPSSPSTGSPRTGLITLAGKGCQGSSYAKILTGAKANRNPGKTPTGALGRVRAPGERANAQLKAWHVLRKLRCCPWRAVGPVTATVRSPSRPEAKTS
jgi:hypothetical protein